MKASHRLPSWAPLAVLVIVSILSLEARVFDLGQPCLSPCTTANDHTLIFDEAYYVNAARVIAGEPNSAGSHYNDDPPGVDPNAEHPQGAKLIMAGAIELFGDGPFAWRIGSVIFGSLAILGMYALVRFSGGGPWSAVGAATLMAADNLMIVTGRIGILDIYCLAPLIWGVAFYMRGRPWIAALLLAIADCMKEVGPYALLVIALLELARLSLARHNLDRPPSWSWRPTLRRVAIVVVGSLALWMVGLELMGFVAKPYADATHSYVTGGAFGHLWHMITYAEGLKTGPGGPTGIASYPWEWLIDLKPITYLHVNPSLPGAFGGVHPVVAFIGMISPPILALAIPAMLFCLYRVARRSPGRRGAQSYEEIQLALLGVAWFIGTWGPYEFQSALDQRISYIYYMIVVMPGIYLAVTYLISSGWRFGLRRDWLWLQGVLGLWGLSVIAAAVVLYPFVAIF